MVAEQPDHLLALAGAHQAVVDEDAGQLVADRLVDQHRRDRRIDAAGEAADHPALADLGADRLARLGAERRHRPVALQPGDLVDEIARSAARRRACGRPRGGTSGRSSGAPRRRSARRARSPRCATRAKPGGSRVMRSPWLIHTLALARLPHAVERAGSRRRRRPRRGRIRGGGRSRPRRRAARPSSSGRSRCPAPARRKQRSPAARAGTALVGHRGRAAGEDHRLGLQRREGALGVLERRDLAIDPASRTRRAMSWVTWLAEIDDQQLVVGECGRVRGLRVFGHGVRWQLASRREAPRLGERASQAQSPQRRGRSGRPAPPRPFALLGELFETRRCRGAPQGEGFGEAAAAWRFGNPCRRPLGSGTSAFSGLSGTEGRFAAARRAVLDRPANAENEARACCV